MKRVATSLLGIFLIFSAFAGTSQAAPKEFIVGCNFTLSGPAAFVGISIQRVVEYTCEVVNKEGFVVQGEKYSVKPVFYDNKYIPAESMLNLEKMLTSGIKFIMSNGSGVTVPLMQKTTAAKVLVMAYASGSHHLTNPKYPLTFRTSPNSEIAYCLYPWLAKAYPQMKKIAHINCSDEAGFTESETRTRCAKNIGFTNVANEFYKRGATDFYPVATKLAVAQPDLIDFGALSGNRDQGLLAKALREVGYKGMIAVSFADPDVFVKIAGADASEGVLLPSSVTEPQNARQQELYDWYVKKYADSPVGIFYDNADSLFMLIEAVKKANSFDPMKVAEALRNIRWDSIFGPMCFDLELVYGIKSSACRPIPMGIIKNGKATHLATLPWPSDELLRRLYKD